MQASSTQTTTFDNPVLQALYQQTQSKNYFGSITLKNIDSKSLAAIVTEPYFHNKIKILSISDSPNLSIPAEINHLISLTELVISSCPRLTFSEHLSCVNLTKLSVNRSEAVQLPVQLTDCTKLASISLLCNKLTQLPESLGALAELEKLDLYDNQINSLPTSLGKCHNLKTLVVSNNPIRTLPEPLANCHKLEKLSLDSCELSIVPACIRAFKNLKELRLRSNNLIDVPKWITELSCLESLALDSNNLSKVPAGLESLNNLLSLYIGGNPITELPLEAFKRANNTAYISAYGCQLSEFTANELSNHYAYCDALDKNDFSITLKHFFKQQQQRTSNPAIAKLLFQESMALLKTLTPDHLNEPELASKQLYQQFEPQVAQSIANIRTEALAAVKQEKIANAVQWRQSIRDELSAGSADEVKISPLPKNRP